jgi:hypothetical protein
MGNTHEHAGGRKKSQSAEKWLATVYADTSRNRICFAFVDTGVGIFRSVRIGKVRRAYRALGIQNNATIFQEILAGKVPSSTQLAYRGKGFPQLINSQASASSNP